MARELREMLRGGRVVGRPGGEWEVGVALAGVVGFEGMDVDVDVDEGDDR